jgi:PIN domain nuclease of toxin-antitoxin system
LKLLLDTHALIWFLAGDETLGHACRSAISDAANVVYVSAVSAMEVTTKHRLGKLAGVDVLAADFDGVVRARGFLELPLTLRHGQMAGAMDIPHKDPFDRLLIAQAVIEQMTLVSNERGFDAFGVSRLW